MVVFCVYASVKFILLVFFREKSTNICFVSGNGLESNVSALASNIFIINSKFMRKKQKRMKSPEGVSNAFQTPIAENCTSCEYLFRNNNK